jgi:ribosomal protein S18 acetylase RimI-like enzyme
MSVEVRRILADEWQELRDVRLRALLDAPDAYGSTYEQESGEPDDTWRDLAASGAEGGQGFTAIAVGDTRLEGLAVGAPHHAFPGEVGLFAMWVDPAWRGRGVGRRLVDGVIAWAAIERFPTIRLLVTETNGPAFRLYERCGFVDTGARVPLREGSDLAAVSMIRSLA